MLLQLASLFTAILAVVAAPNQNVSRFTFNDLGLEGAPTLTAQSAFLIDLTSGTILLQKNADASYPIASITKLATALVLLDKNPHWSTLVTFTAADKRNGGIPYLIPGEQVTILEAWNLMLVGSSNDAAQLLARVFFDNNEKFVEAMNAKARTLGLYRTNFADPTGLDPQNISTAREVAALTRLALAHASVREALRKRKITITPLGKAPRLVYSTNWLLGSFSEATDVFGGKTGHIEESGYNLVFSAGKNGHELLGVVLGAESNEARFSEMKELLNWGFNVVQEEQSPAG